MMTPARTADATDLQRRPARAGVRLAGIVPLVRQLATFSTVGAARQETRLTRSAWAISSPAAAAGRRNAGARSRPMGGTREVDAAIRNGMVAGAVRSMRPGPKTRMLVDLPDLGIPFSMDLIAVKRDFAKSSP